jgi:hypothetical protein
MHDSRLANFFVTWAFLELCTYLNSHWCSFLYMSFISLQHTFPMPMLGWNAGFDCLLRFQVSTVFEYAIMEKAAIKVLCNILFIFISAVVLCLV